MSEIKTPPELRDAKLASSRVSGKLSCPFEQGQQGNSIRFNERLKARLAGSKRDLLPVAEQTLDR